MGEWISSAVVSVFAYQILDDFGWMVMMLAGAVGYAVMAWRHRSTRWAYRIHFRCFQAIFHMLLFGGLSLTGLFGLLGVIGKK